MRKETFTITNTTKGRLPRLPFSKIKEKIVGKKFTVSMVCIGDTRSRSLNKKYRRKDAPANVLTFPLSPHEGEIYLNPGQIRRDTTRFGEPYRTLFARMFIHGLLHLKGRVHNSTMEEEESRLLRNFL